MKKNASSLPSRPSGNEGDTIPMLGVILGQHEGVDEDNTQP